MHATLIFMQWGHKQNRKICLRVCNVKRKEKNWGANVNKCMDFHELQRVFENFGATLVPSLIRVLYHPSKIINHEASKITLDPSGLTPIWMRPPLDCGLNIQKWCVIKPLNLWRPNKEVIIIWWPSNFVEKWSHPDLRNPNPAVSPKMSLTVDHIKHQGVLMLTMYEQNLAWADLITLRWTPFRVNWALCHSNGGMRSFVRMLPPTSSSMCSGNMRCVVHGSFYIRILKLLNTSTC